MLKFIKSLFCKHDYYADSNIYGDMINVCNGNRTVLKCKKCGKFKSYRAFLKKGTKAD